MSRLLPRILAGALLGLLLWLLCATAVGTSDDPDLAKRFEAAWWLSPFGFCAVGAFLGAVYRWAVRR